MIALPNYLIGFGRAPICANSSSSASFKTSAMSIDRSNGSGFSDIIRAFRHFSDILEFFG